MSDQPILKTEPEFVEVEVVVKHKNGKTETARYYKVPQSTLKMDVEFYEEHSFSRYSHEIHQTQKVKRQSFSFKPLEVDGKYGEYRVDTPD